MLRGLLQVLTKKQYLIGIVLLTGFTYVSIIFSQNINFVEVVAHGSATFSKKLSLLLSLLFASFSRDQLTTIFITVSIAFLFSLNIGLTIFVFNRQLGRVRGNSTLGAVGLLSALFGFGCASCGPILITSLLPFLGLSGLLKILPFEGKEFEMIGFLILLLSVYFLSKEASKPAVC
jgi:hypothetical protein